MKMESKLKIIIITLKLRNWIWFDLGKKHIFKNGKLGGEAVGENCWGSFVCGRRAREASAKVLISAHLEFGGGFAFWAHVVARHFLDPPLYFCILLNWPLNCLLFYLFRYGHTDDTWLIIIIVIGTFIIDLLVLYWSSG